MTDQKEKNEFLGALLIMEVILEAAKPVGGIEKAILFEILLGAVTPKAFDDLLEQAKDANVLAEENGFIFQGAEYTRGVENIQRLIAEGKR